MENYLNQLPTELQKEIFKNYPAFIQISKNYNKKEYTDLFYDTYCINITKQEFINYIKNYSPSIFVIYQYFTNMLFLHYFIKNDQRYKLNIVSIKKENNEIIINLFQPTTILKNTAVIPTINKILNNNNTKFEFDFKTIYNIYNLKTNCKKINSNFINNVMLKNINNHYKDFDIYNIDTVYNALIQLIYLMDIPEFDEFEYLINKMISFDNNGIPTNIKKLNDFIKFYKKNIKYYYDALINHFTTL